VKAMQGAQFFLTEHALAHSGRLVGVEEYDRAFYEDRAVRGLTELQLRARRDIGTGMTAEEVSVLSEAIDIPSLRRYRLAVGKRTRDLVPALSPERWEETVDASKIRRAFEEGAFLPDHTWPYDFWGGKPVARLLAWPCLGHSLMHLGQAMWVGKLVLAQTPPG
jgi:hypothetical protein